ncbi:MAG TPA: AAA family ATPase [Gemmatimonadales bacterium]|nr:AAA family ATPase [Gemmatimonadales bacterium]
MNLALSGTHASGKTTLAERLIRSLPDHTIVDEPYFLLESQGHHFYDPPTPDDFELQLTCSLDAIEAATGNCIFDRSPIDFLAYLLAGPGHAAVDFDRWIPRVRRAIARLDLIVYGPLEEPDRMRDIPVERPRLRRRMDEGLRELLEEDPWELGARVLEVRGSEDERARQVLTHLGR